VASGASGSHRRWAGGTALAGIALLLVACGGGGSPALGGTTAYQKALAYSQCMRAHGVPGFPDPQPNGAILINGQKDHLNGAQVNAADKTCHHLLPNGGRMTAAQQKQALDQGLRFVACMRSHGIADMPDPSAQGGGVGLRLPRGLNVNSPVFKSAQQACHKLLPGGPA